MAKKAKYLGLLCAHDPKEVTGAFAVAKAKLETRTAHPDT